MNRLAGSIFVVLIALLTAIGSAVIVGRSQPLSPGITLLHLNECPLPCWIGIVPGETTVEQASRRIQAVYGSQAGVEVSGHDAQFLIHDTLHGSEFIVALYTEPDVQVSHDVIKTIWLGTLSNGDGPRLAELYSTVGEPDAVVSGDLDLNSSSLSYFDQRMTLNFGFTGCSTIMNQVVGSIILADSKMGRDKFASRLRPWRGFTRC